MNGIPTVPTLPSTPGSTSSKITAATMVEAAKNQRQRAWEYIASQGSKGATYKDLKILFKMDGPRMTELRRLGRVRQTGDMRKTDTGRPADVYVAVPREEWPEPKTGWPTPEAPVEERTGTARLRGENEKLWSALEIFSDSRRNMLQPCPFCFNYGEHSGRVYREWKDEYGKGRCIVEDINKREGV